MITEDHKTFDAISSEYIAAHAELDRVFKARGIRDGQIPVISRSDEEAMAAVQRMRAAQEHMNVWLDANVR